MAGDDPLARDVPHSPRHSPIRRATPRTSLPYPTKRCLVSIQVYGLGSLEFRPEDTLGAYDYAHGKIRCQDGIQKDDGESYFTLGINHPCNVR